MKAKKGTRRKYGADLKKLILAECTQPGASVAGVALSHGINANTVHKWRRQATGAGAPAPAGAGAGALAPVVLPSFVPVSLPPPACAPAAGPAPDIRIELRRGATNVTLTWPVAAAEHCAVWMRELLK